MSEVAQATNGITFAVSARRSLKQTLFTTQNLVKCALCVRKEGERKCVEILSKTGRNRWKEQAKGND
jgi:hypothetical protein